MRLFCQDIALWLILSLLSSDEQEYRLSLFESCPCVTWVDCVFYTDAVSP